MNVKYQVFISSTMIDLEQERRAVGRAISKMNLIPSGMEFFPATSMEQFEYIKRVIDDCDYYVLLMGARYGSLTSEGTSFTEAEFDYAIDKGKVVLVFVHENPESFALRKVDTEPEKRQKFAAFREKVRQNRIVESWREESDLVSAVVTSLHQATKESPAVGWMRADFRDNRQQVTDAVRELQSRAWTLQNEVRSLTADLADASSAIQIMFMATTKPATEAEIQAWIEGAKGNYPSPEQYFLGHQAGLVRYADEDFVLPKLYGNHARTVIVARGVRVQVVGDGAHSRLLYMDGFRAQGS